MSQCKVLLWLVFGHLLLHHVSYAINQYIGDNETYWKSTTQFIPQPASFYGYIKIGKTMSMEFDVIWHGRSSPNNLFYEQFFNVLLSEPSTNNFNINNKPSSYYPSLYLQPSRNAFHLTINNENYDLNNLPLTIGQSYHFLISFNYTEISIQIDDKLHINDVTSSVNQQYINELAKIWFTSSDNTDICGNATFSNILIKSDIFVITSSTNNDGNDTTKKDGDYYWIIYVMIILCIVCLIIICCYKAKQIRKDFIKSQPSIEEQVSNATSTSVNINDHDQQLQVPQTPPTTKHINLSSASSIPLHNKLSNHNSLNIDDYTKPSMQKVRSDYSSASNKEYLSTTTLALSPTDSIRDSMAKAIQLTTTNSYNSYGKRNSAQFMVNSRTSPLHEEMEPDMNIPRRALSAQTSIEDTSTKHNNVSDVIEGSLSPSPESVEVVTHEMVKTQSMGLEEEDEEYEEEESVLGYKRISDVLMKIDGDKHDYYLERFKERRVSDKRVSLTLDADLKSLIPDIVIREQFKEMLKDENVDDYVE